MGRAAPPAALGVVGASFVGTCVREAHPVLVGRVLVRPPVGPDAWLPVVRHVAVRRGDRVVVARPDGLDEPVVLGVLDGYRPAGAPPSREVARVGVGPGEAVVIAASDGTPLARIARVGDGVEVGLCAPDAVLAWPGALDLSADRITLRARSGEARLEAEADVVVRGRVIHLN